MANLDSDPRKTTNSNVDDDFNEIFEDEEETPEEDLEKEERLQANNFELTDIRKPAQQKPVGQVPVGKRAELAGRNMASNLPQSDSTIRRALNFPQGLSRAYQAGRNLINRQRPTPSPEQQKKAEKAELNKTAAKSALKTGQAVSRIAASGGTDVLAWGQAISNGFKAAWAYTKAHKQEAIVALGISLLPFILAFGLFSYGYTTKLPGNNSGTSFPQTQVKYDILQKLRQISEGDKTAALAKELNQNGLNQLKTELSNLVSQVEEDKFFEGPNLETFKSHVSQIIALLTEASSATLDEAGIATLLTKMQPIATELIALYDDVLAKVLGQKDSKSGFYQLPDLSPYYVRKDPNRAWGRPELIYTIINSAKAFKEKYPKYLLRISDMSLPTGGDITNHVSHECGNDVDITVAHLDRLDAPDGALMVKKKVGASIVINYTNNGVRTKDKTFNSQMAKDLADIFLANGTAIVAFTYPFNDYPKFEKWPGHEDHMHIRIFNQGNIYPDCLQK